MTLLVEGRNLAARRLYEAAGFHQVARFVSAGSRQPLRLRSVAARPHGHTGVGGQRRLSLLGGLGGGAPVCDNLLERANRVAVHFENVLEHYRDGTGAGRWRG